MTARLLVGLVLILARDHTAAAQTGGCGSIADTAPIAAVGAFSNMRYTAEHAYGFTLMLWRAGDCPVGLLLSSEGLAGDTPIGLLEEIRLDSKTGRLSFAAKLTMGALVGRSATDLTPTRDLYAFDGQFKADAVSGTMTHTIQNTPRLPARQTNVVLNASGSEAGSMQGQATYGEWRQRWEPILKIRGPKWGAGNPNPAAVSYERDRREGSTPDGRRPDRPHRVPSASAECGRSGRIPGTRRAPAG